MKVLLTGANGFVGTYLQQQLPCIPLEDHGKRVDIRDIDGVKRVIAEIQPEAVIHLAAQSFLPESFSNPIETFETNLWGTFNLLTALKEHSFTGRMLFVGSSEMYGWVSQEYLPVEEHHPLKPRSPYAVSKVAAEALCYQWSQTEKFDVVMVRPFNHIGPGQSPRRAISAFAQQIVEIKQRRREPVLEVGDIDVTRDFTDVRDIVRAYILLLEKGRNGEVYNVCSRSDLSIRSLLTKLLLLAGVDAKIKGDPARMREVEQRVIYGSFEKLYKDVGWKPGIPIDQSLKEILHYWEKELR